MNKYILYILWLFGFILDYLQNGDFIFNYAFTTDIVHYKLKLNRVLIILYALKYHVKYIKKGQKR